MGDLGRAVTDALTQNVATVVAYLPRLVVFLVVLLVGYIVARLVGRAVDLLLTRLGLDELAGQAGLTEDLARAGVQVRPVHGLATGLHRADGARWLIIDHGRQRLRVDKVVLATGHAELVASVAEDALRGTVMTSRSSPSTR